MKAGLDDVAAWHSPAVPVRRAMKRRGPRGEGLLRAASLLAFLALWQLAAWFFASPTLPPPATVFARIAAETASLALPTHLAITLARVAVAFLLALAIGAAIGIAMGRWRRLDALLDGWLVLGLNIPALVTIILCYVWFGLNDTAAIVAVALNKIPTVVVTVREGARAVDARLMQVAHAYRLPRLRTFTHVYLPQLVPYLMASARAGLSLIWKIVLVVELLGRSNGVGFQLNMFFQLFDIAGILAYTLVFAAVVLVVEAAGLRPLERRLTRWRT
ncbi:ABC transporter permease [Aromatoleum toluclasticum]|uniref:ABC transporter permease n=1 Tax=Aromatoleum toluclasticum TaxID=92003 RepID=UPI0003756B66|nr:ABC transporter permease [Aromatoleum toluclasticum]